MRPWLVSLALAVVILPAIGEAADTLRVRSEHHAVTTTAATPALAGEPAPVLEAASSTHDLFIKERGELLAVDRSTQLVKWARPTPSSARAAVIGDTVVDAWVDGVSHRYGVVTYDRTTGKQLASVELGKTGGWYDLERLLVAPDGPGEVLVSALFGVGAA